MIYVVTLVLALLLALCLWLYKQQMDKNRDEAVQNQKRAEMLQLQVYEAQSKQRQAEESFRIIREGEDALRSELTTLRARGEHLAQELSALRVELSYTKEQLKVAQEAQSQLTSGLKAELKELSTQILQERSASLKEANDESLRPLREELKRFSEQVQQSYSYEARERHSLQQEIKNLMERSLQVSQETTQLTQALKGDSKVQGDWGEMILENILSHSGLREGEEYTLQYTLRDEDGRVIKSEDGGSGMRPDAVVHYPNGGTLIIDSKVSLSAYVRYVSAQTDAERQEALTAHLSSIRGHIRQLSSKAYYQHLDSAPDFVMLFVPNEPAYILALKEEPNLWEEAYRQHVILINSTNLIAALRMALDLWQRDKQIKSVDAITKEATNLYDKFVTFSESFLKLEKQLEQMQSVYQQARGQLTDGRGSIITRIEKMRKLGLSPKKEIPLALQDKEDN